MLLVAFSETMLPASILVGVAAAMAVKKILCPPPKNQFTGDRTDL